MSGGPFHFGGSLAESFTRCGGSSAENPRVLVPSTAPFSDTVAFISCPPQVGNYCCNLLNDAAPGDSALLTMSLPEELKHAVIYAQRAGPGRASRGSSRPAASCWYFWLCLFLAWSLLGVRTDPKLVQGDFS